MTLCRGTKKGKLKKRAPVLKSDTDDRRKEQVMSLMPEKRQKKTLQRVVLVREAVLRLPINGPQGLPDIEHLDDLKPKGF